MCFMDTKVREIYLLIRKLPTILPLDVYGVDTVTKP